MGGDGVIYVHHPTAGSHTSHVDYLLRNREFGKKSSNGAAVVRRPDEQGGVAGVEVGQARKPARLALRQSYGNIRSMLTLKEDICCGTMNSFFTDIMTPVGELSNGGVIYSLPQVRLGAFWRTFASKTGLHFAAGSHEGGPHYKRSLTSLAKHGLDICSLDCDGYDRRIDSDLDRERRQHDVPDRGGHLEASIRPWRKKWAGPSASVE